MFLSTEILKEEIKKTKETLETIKKMRAESQQKQEQIEEDCEVGMAINQFVLEKLEEKLKSD